MRKIVVGTLTVAACVLLVSALPEPIGSSANASPVCDTTCLATYAGCRTMCHTNVSSCKKTCVAETETYSAERACIRSCSSEEDDCLDTCKLILRACGALCD
jgi:hypothetical protein